jgi:hypothetical protein
MARLVPYQQVFKATIIMSGVQAVSSAPATGQIVAPRNENDKVDTYDIILRC